MKGDIAMAKVTKIDTKQSNNKKKLRVAAYARVSTGSDKQLVSLESQKTHYEQYIQARPGWEYVGLYFDEGISGTKLAKREGLKDLLRDCDKGLIDYIIVKSISRFSRNTVDSIEIVRSLCEKNIYIYFEKENIDTGKMEGELLLSILSSLAENESRSISDNEKWSVQKRFMNGTYIISYPPYGYKNENGKMVINEDEARTVRWIFDEIQCGKSLGAVAKELNDRSVPTKRGKKWDGAVIGRMVKNEKYVGDAIFQKTYTDDKFTRHINRGERNQYYVKDHHEAIVTRKAFEAANAIVEANGSDKGVCKNSKKYSNRYVLSGKIICGECGHTWKRIKRANYFGFACSNHIKNKNNCSMKAIKEEAVKSAFVTMMNKLTFAREKVLVPYSKKIGSSSDHKERLNKLEESLKKNAERRQQLVKFLTKGLLDSAVYEEESETLIDEEQRLISEKNKVLNEANGDSDVRCAIDKLLRYTSKGVKITEFNDELFSEHVDRIIVFNRNEIGFVMKCGPVFRERI